MDSRPSDERLLLAVAEDDMGAFRTLYERHAGWLAIRLTRRCNDRDLVADAIQDTFVAVWQRPQGFRGDGDIAAWLWGIAIRRLVSRLRTRSSVAAVFENAEAAPAAEDQVLLSVEYGDIGQALARLSPEMRAVIQALAGNVLLGFAAACVIRTRTGEPGATADAAVVLVLMAPSLVPQIARWVRTFPASGASGQSSDHVWWTVLAVCVVAIAISVGGRSLPRWMSSVPGEATP
jgi:RNA polymerase sigma factor (sigma-70 family)